MSLHLSKVAVQCASAEALHERMAARAEDGIVRIVTRYRPTRHAELIGGSLYWIIKHRLIARQTILGFDEAEEKKCAIVLDARLVSVRSRYKGVHQGWRYLAAADAPEDFGGGAALAELPRALVEELAGLGLV